MSYLPGALQTVSFAVTVGCTSMALALEPMNTTELADITGREGINIALELRINTDENGDPITSGANYTNCGSTTNFSSTGCRLALQYANRLAGGGEWVVLKNFYGRINIPSIYLDASRTPAASTAYQDLDRFRDEDGVPLLSSPNDVPAVAFTFPRGIELELNAGLAVEFGATGYLNNTASTPYMSVKVANTNPNLPAQLTVEGTMRWYGF